MLKHLLLFLLISSASITVPQSDFAIGINGNVNFPNGKFTEFFNIGYGGDAHFLYLFGNSTIFSFTVGYNMFDFDVDAFNERAKELGLDAHFDIESYFSAIPILIGAKWYFLQQKKHNIYIMLEAGFYSYQLSFKGSANLISPGGNSIPVTLPEIDEKGTESMLKISAGYIFFFSENWFLDASVGYTVLTNAFVVNEPSDPENPDAVYGVAGTLNYISVLGGVNYRF